MRGKLTVPRSQEDALARILRMSQEDMSAFIEALHSAEHTHSIRRLSEAIAKASGVGESEAFATIRVLSSLSTMVDRLGISLVDFPSEIERAARDTSNDALRDPEIGWDAGKTRFRDLLSCKSLIVTAKAHALLSESERVFCDARIVSDVRPVFVGSAEDGPDAFVVLHTLRVSFHTNGGLESLDIALDSADVKLLEDAAKRATVKERSVAGLIESTGKPVMHAITHEG